MKNKEVFVMRITSARLDERISLSDISSLESVEFYKAISEDWFSWRAVPKYPASLLTIRPKASVGRIKTWKTLEGAKRNFLKTMAKKVENENSEQIVAADS